MSEDPIIKAELVSTGFGVKVPKVGLGINIISGFYLRIEYLGKKTLYGVASHLNGDQGNLIFHGISTDKFPVKYNFAGKAKPHDLGGHLVDLEIDAGFVIAKWGDIDIKLTIFDENKQPLFSIEKVDIPAQGIMLLDAKIRGELVNMSSAS